MEKCLLNSENYVRKFEETTEIIDPCLVLFYQLLRNACDLAKKQF